MKCLHRKTFFSHLVAQGRVEQRSINPVEIEESSEARGLDPYLTLSLAVKFVCEEEIKRCKKKKKQQSTAIEYGHASSQWQSTEQGNVAVDSLFAAFLHR
jgi:hypothetical protein